MVVPQLAVGRTPFYRYGATRWRNIDWTVFFHVSDTRGGCDHIVGRLESSGEILGENQGKVIMDRKHFSFLV